MQINKIRKEIKSGRLQLVPKKDDMKEQELREAMGFLLEDKDAHFTSNWVIISQILALFNKALPELAKEAGYFLEEAELVGKYLARGWIPPEEAEANAHLIINARRVLDEAKNYVKLTDLKKVIRQVVISSGEEYRYNLDDTFCKDKGKKPDYFDITIYPETELYETLWKEVCSKQGGAK